MSEERTIENDADTSTNESTVMSYNIDQNTNINSINNYKNDASPTPLSPSYCSGSSSYSSSEDDDDSLSCSSSQAGFVENSPPTRQPRPYLPSPATSSLTSVSRRNLLPPSSSNAVGAIAGHSTLDSYSSATTSRGYSFHSGSTLAYTSHSGSTTGASGVYDGFAAERERPSMREESLGSSFGNRARLDSSSSVYSVSSVENGDLGGAHGGSSLPRHHHRVQSGGGRKNPFYDSDDYSNHSIIFKEGGSHVRTTSEISVDCDSLGGGSTGGGGGNATNGKVVGGARYGVSAMPSVDLTPFSNDAKTLPYHQRRLLRDKLTPERPSNKVRLGYGDMKDIPPMGLAVAAQGTGGSSITTSPPLISSNIYNKGGNANANASMVPKKYTEIESAYSLTPPSPPKPPVHILKNNMASLPPPLPAVSSSKFQSKRPAKLNTMRSPPPPSNTPRPVGARRYLTMNDFQKEDNPNSINQQQQQHQQQRVSRSSNPHHQHRHCRSNSFESLSPHPPPHPKQRASGSTTHSNKNHVRHPSPIPPLPHHHHYHNNSMDSIQSTSTATSNDASTNTHNTTPTQTSVLSTLSDKLAKDVAQFFHMESQGGQDGDDNHHQQQHSQPRNESSGLFGSLIHRMSPTYLHHKRSDSLEDEKRDYHAKNMKFLVKAERERAKLMATVAAQNTLRSLSPKRRPIRTSSPRPPSTKGSHRPGLASIDNDNWEEDYVPAKSKGQTPKRANSSSLSPPDRKSASRSDRYNHNQHHNHNHNQHHNHNHHQPVSETPMKYQKNDNSNNGMDPNAKTIKRHNTKTKYQQYDSKDDNDSCSSDGTEWSDLLSEDNDKDDDEYSSNERDESSASLPHSSTSFPSDNYNDDEDGDETTDNTTDRNDEAAPLLLNRPTSARHHKTPSGISTNESHCCNPPSNNSDYSSNTNNTNSSNTDHPSNEPSPLLSPATRKKKNFVKIERLLEEQMRFLRKAKRKARRKKEKKLLNYGSTKHDPRKYRSRHQENSSESSSNASSSSSDEGTYLIKANKRALKLEKERTRLIESWKAEARAEAHAIRKEQTENRWYNRMLRYIPQLYASFKMQLFKYIDYAEMFLSNLPMTISAVAMAIVTLGCVWYKFMEENMDSCVPAHFHSEQCIFPEFPGCFECDTEAFWYKAAVLFHYFCSILAGTLAFMFIAKAFLATRVVIDEMSSPTTSSPAGLICMTTVCVFAGRGVIGQFFVSLAAATHLAFMLWFVYLVAAYNSRPDPSWYPNTVGIGLCAVKSWLYYPTGGHILMVISMALNMLFFPISVIRVYLNEKISAPVCWIQMSAPAISLYALTIVAQPQHETDLYSLHHLHKMIYLPIMHFMFFLNLIASCSSSHSLWVRWKTFSKKEFSPAHTAFCFPTLAHANAIQAYRGAVIAYSDTPAGTPYKLFIYFYWCFVLIGGTIATVVITAKFFYMLPSWTMVDVDNEEEPPAPNETLISDVLHAGEHLFQPFVNPAVLQANETGALIRVVGRGMAGARGEYKRTRRVMALGFEPTMNWSEMKQEEEILLEYVDKFPPRERKRTLSVPGVDFMRGYGNFGTGNSGVYDLEGGFHPFERSERNRANTTDGGTIGRTRMMMY